MFEVVLSPYDNVMSVLGKKGRAERTPCVNFAEIYTEELMEAAGSSWPSAHRDPERMAKLGLAAHRIAGLDNVSVPFDILVEAEALGVPVNFHGERVVWPSAASHPVTDPSDVDVPGDVASAGRIPVVAKAISALAEELDGKVPVNAVVTPPFTAASSLLADPVTYYYWVSRDRDKAKAVLDAVLPMYIAIAKLYVEAGADIITLHEMGGSTESVSPSVFQSLVTPYLRRLVGAVKAPVVLNICGRTDLISNYMVGTGAAAIAFDETTPVRLMKEKVDEVRPGYPIIGNLSPLKVIHSGPKELIEAQVREAVESGITMVSPGCDFWIGTPTEHIRWLVQATAASK